MEKTKDKNIPLMKPTFFEEDDPNNPKYVDKKKEIEEWLEMLDFRKKDYKDRKRFDIFWAVIFFIVACIAISTGAIPVSIPAFIMVIYHIKSYNYDKNAGLEHIARIENKILQLQQSIEEEKIKAKVKSLSKDDKKILGKVIKDPTLNDVIKKALEHYENAIFISDIESILYSDNDDFTDIKSGDKSLSLAVIEKRRNN